MKRDATFLVIVSLIFWTFLSSSITLAQEQPTTSTWQVYFSPHGGCTDAIIRELNKAKTTILVQDYSFTSAPIAKAPLNAHKRGVRIEVIKIKKKGLKSNDRK
jgi:phosphatidylserine/phosphatidylglycerophosphate/cardiolipin synthase-like enzyme